MDSPHFERLRTAIVVTGMIVLPLIAVAGLRLPWETPGTKSAGHAIGAVPMPSGKTVAETAPLTQDSLTLRDQASANTNFPKPSHNPVQLTANHDVRASRLGAASLPERFVPADAVYPLPTPDVESPTPATVEVQADRFSRIQKRLRALGATHYALETWGSQGELYRFQCRMAAGHQPGYSRQFEATDADAVRVMQTVLDDVEAWKAGRLP